MKKILLLHIIALVLLSCRGYDKGANIHIVEFPPVSLGACYSSVIEKLGKPDSVITDIEYPQEYGVADSLLVYNLSDDEIVYVSINNKSTAQLNVYAFNRIKDSIYNYVSKNYKFSGNQLGARYTDGGSTIIDVVVFDSSETVRSEEMYEFIVSPIN